MSTVKWVQIIIKDDATSLDCVCKQLRIARDLSSSITGFATFENISIYVHIILAVLYEDLKRRVS
jgi:hypothetical protein